jgi:hypothetical protein
MASKSDTTDDTVAQKMDTIEDDNMIRKPQDNYRSVCLIPKHLSDLTLLVARSDVLPRLEVERSSVVRQGLAYAR